MSATVIPMFRKGEFESAPTIRQKPTGPADEEQQKLFCAFCHFHITDSSEAITEAGKHTHTFSNPAGFIYTVDCFASAPGCKDVGQPIAEHSWFNGYKWQLALCRSCQNHLGWHFVNSGSFYALIQGRLTSLS
ncbi:MAG: cereblon family protein [Gammaproteobacteria bacterium]